MCIRDRFLGGFGGYISAGLSEWAKRGNLRDNILYISFHFNIIFFIELLSFVSVISFAAVGVVWYRTNSEGRDVV